jgi:hypothetical protein
MLSYCLETPLGVGPLLAIDALLAVGTAEGRVPGVRLLPGDMLLGVGLLPNEDTLPAVGVPFTEPAVLVGPLAAPSRIVGAVPGVPLLLLNAGRRPGV